MYNFLNKNNLVKNEAGRDKYYPYGCMEMDGNFIRLGILPNIEDFEKLSAKQLVENDVIGFICYRVEIKANGNIWTYIAYNADCSTLEGAMDEIYDEGYEFIPDTSNPEIEKYYQELCEKWED